MVKLLEFLDNLEKNKIYYRLNKIRDSILVEIVVPGERWEVEYFADGTIEIERFFSDGQIKGENEIELLFEKFSD